ncbi:tripartite tricarboxylate transporter substrate binding protein [uncultured Rhodoferax sp.]|uniref:Bug family tripartite tricarboxylate transporter substrate binding protein n=1 Tax=uncultured Rhodoferax sp. TaxID=223188 RepID=UPI0025E46DAC|nr:tripartite tricarboxylate transporter substrate binding protein [uncultured Rhodoferax sp.]
MHPCTRRNILQQAGLWSALGALPALSQAEAAWPSKPVSYIVPFTPGGSTDIIGRTITTKLAERLGQPFVVDNKPGAAGAIGAGFVAKATPDGHTLLGGTISTHAINASLYKNLAYDPVKDFEPISLLASLPNMLIVNASLGVNSVADLIALLKRDSRMRVFASSGAGTSTHLAGELLADIIGVPLTHVPYKGTPPAMTDVASGQVPFMFDQMTAALPLVQSGKLKFLAVTTSRRSHVTPDIPTMQEAGVAKFEMSSWQAMYAPKGTPKPIVERLHAEIVKVLALPDVKDKLSNQLGMNIIGSTPAELRAHMAAEIPRWADLVQKSGASAS